MNDTRIYQVANWNDRFENSRSREIEVCSWVGIPNKHHGTGFTRILSSPDGMAKYGLWCLIVQACSRQLSSTTTRRNGWLTDDGLPSGHPWDADDLALRWRQPPNVVQDGLDLFCSPRVGWMLVHDHMPIVELVDGGVSADGRQSIGKQQPRGATRRERKGTEVNGTPPTSTPAVFHVQGVNEELIRQAMAGSDLIALVQAFGADGSVDHQAAWARDADQKSLHEILAIFAWRRRQRDPIRLPSGFRQALIGWRALPMNERKDLCSALLAEYGVDVPPFAGDDPGTQGSVA